MDRSIFEECSDIVVSGLKLSVAFIESSKIDYPPPSMDGVVFIVIVGVMSKNKKGYEAVNQDEEWIEMEDLRLPHNQNLSQKLAQ